MAKRQMQRVEIREVTAEGVKVSYMDMPRPLKTPKPWEYRNIKFDAATGRIEGEKRGGYFPDEWILFSAGRTLFMIDMAMELFPKSIRQFMSFADGYGEPGYFPGGYDWSGIRDSSAQAKALMLTLAEKLLAGRKMPWE